MGLFILLLGVQGAGKGTQAKFLSEAHDIPHISTGDLFRAMKTETTPLAQEVQQLMNAGELISDEITNRIVDERLKKPDAQNGAILDGYPRSAGQAEALDKMLAEHGEELTVALVLELDRETAIKRSEGRRYSQDKERVYNVYFNPPKTPGIDDVDGQPLIQRDDDNRDAVERRIDLYFESTAPLIEYYEDKGLVTRINANQPIEDVTADIMAAVEAASRA